jgi:hypothetical protein
MPCLPHDLAFITQLDLTIRLADQQITNTAALSRNVSAAPAIGKTPLTEPGSDATTWRGLIKTTGPRSRIQSTPIHSQARNGGAVSSIVRTLFLRLFRLNNPLCMIEYTVLDAKGVRFDVLFSGSPQRTRLRGPCLGVCGLYHRYHRHRRGSCVASNLPSKSRVIR